MDNTIHNLIRGKTSFNRNIFFFLSNSNFLKDWNDFIERFQWKNFFLSFLKAHIFLEDCIYLFLERGEGREIEREKDIDGLPLTVPSCGPGLRLGQLKANIKSLPNAEELEIFLFWLNCSIWTFHDLYGLVYKSRI